MFFDALFRSLEPLHNPIGFAGPDFVEFGVACILIALALMGGRWRRIEARPVAGMLFFAVVPVALRLLMLRQHPAPLPDIYDEFGHLLVADTLRHWRLANPPHQLHRFFETFFVLQQPTYSSIYPVGNGLALATGWAMFGLPWAGVLMCVAALCSLSFWMLRAWTTPGWALIGGLLAVMEFGPFHPWTNSYWGGSLAAAAGCLVFGALPRLSGNAPKRNAALLGIGLAIHLLVRPYESIFLAIGVVAFLAFERCRLKPLIISAVIILPALAITLIQNQRVTGRWTQLPYALSQYQYGVPAALTFQSKPTPHADLTPQQSADYRMQLSFHPGTETPTGYISRLAYHAREYRFYFLPPLYFALIAFLVNLRTKRNAWIAGTCLVFALGTNFFPAFRYHYEAAIVCLFLLISVEGLRYIAKLRNGPEAARALVFVCVAQFLFSIPGAIAPNSERRFAVARQIARTPGKLLVFVRYWPQHIFQDEWVYNGADIDGQRVVWARDLGDTDDRNLIAYYPDRKLLLLEPDAAPPKLGEYTAEAPKAEPVKPPTPATRPLLELEQVR